MSLTHLATTIGTGNLVLVLAGFAAIAIYAANRGYGRTGPTLAVLALGTPLAVLLGMLTGALARDTTTDLRWLYAGVLALALAVAGTLIGAGIRAAVHDTPHHCEASAEGRCVGCGQRLHDTTDRVGVAA